MRAKLINRTDLDLILERCDRQETVMLLASNLGGLRALEISRLDWRMLTDSAGSLADFIDLPAIASKGRTGQGRIPMAPALHSALLRLAAARRFPRSGPVCLSAKGRALSAHAVAQRIGRIYKSNGLDCSSHSGRRSFATQLAGSGLNAFQVQRAMRHSHVSTTRLYVDDAMSDRAVASAIAEL